MSPSLVDAESLLSIDVGTTSTRAMLFDVVDGRYRFLALGSSASTASAPFRDIGEGIHRALLSLQEITGRVLVGPDGKLLTPSQSDGSGVDTCVATLSVGYPLRVVVAGLLDDVSVESVRRLVNTTYAAVVETFGLNDRRKPAARIDAILRLRPDVIVVAGGTEGGASQSVLNVLESIGLACHLFPQQKKPEVLFAGNQALSEEIKTLLDPIVPLHLAPNIRPALEIEQIGPAQEQMAQVYRLVRAKTMAGVNELDLWTNNRLLPTASAFGKLIRFLSRIYNPSKGVLGIDIGASATTVAAAFAGELMLGVYPSLGLGEPLAGLLNTISIGELVQWLPMEIPDDEVRHYVLNKALNPTGIPETVEELALEQALARGLIQAALRKLSPQFPEKAGRSAPGLLPWFEPVVVTGSVLTQAANRGQSLMMVLDALQPTGVTLIALDRNNLAPSLGAAGIVNPTLAVQVLESGSLLNLGTVVSPVGRATYGTPVLKVRAAYENGNTANFEVKYGAIELIPLPMGQSANLSLQPLHRFDIGMGGAGRGGSVKVTGGVFGVVIDARGRPLKLPEDPGRRRELLKKWLWTLGS